MIDSKMKIEITVVL